MQVCADNIVNILNIISFPHYNIYKLSSDIHKYKIIIIKLECKSYSISNDTSQFRHHWLFESEVWLGL